MTQSNSANIHPLRTTVVLLLLFLAAWLPRVMTLDAFTTPDEQKWMSRSANFSYALSHGDLAGAMQSEHPGVTVMWAGALGLMRQIPDYSENAPGQLKDFQLEAWLRDNSAVSALELLVAGRWWVALAISLTVTAMFFPLRRLFGALTAGLAVLFIAWDPYFLALSRMLHLDGLLTALTCLALLSYLAWLYASQKPHYLVVSAVLLALAILTKIPAVFLIPSAGLITLFEIIRRRRSGEGSSRVLLAGFVIWGVVAAVTFIALWPALWVNAYGVFMRILSTMRTYAAGHELPNFFMGEVTDDPGPTYYPVAYLFRTTPLTLFGLAAACVVFFRRNWPLDSSVRRNSVFALLLYALVFTVGISLGDKQFDRYLLPIFLPLDIIAVLGWLGITRGFSNWWQARRGQTANDVDTGGMTKFGVIGLLLLAILFLIHGATSLRHYPYYLTYYNPLVGGARIAPQTLMVGWGEGLDAAADWLNQQPGSDNIKVASWYAYGPTSYFLKTDKRTLGYTDPDYWFDADYAILYVNQWQRQIPSRQILEYFSQIEPVHVVRRHGLELARVYDMRNVEPPAFTHISTDTSAVFSDKMRLAAYMLPNPTMLPGEQSNITLFLEKLIPVDVDYTVRLQLISEDGTEVWSEERWPSGVRTTHWPVEDLWHDPYEIIIPESAAPGRYSLVFSVHDPITNQRLPVLVEKTSTVIDNGLLEFAWLEVQAPNSIHLDARWDRVHLTGLQHQPVITPGVDLIVMLSTQVMTDEAVKISVRLLDPSGKVIAQYDRPLAPEIRFKLPVPADVDAATYTLAVVVYDEESLEPFPDVHGDFSVPLSQITIRR